MTVAFGCSFSVKKIGSCSLINGNEEYSIYCINSLVERSSVIVRIKAETIIKGIASAL